jgi:hypothetical protein
MRVLHRQEGLGLISLLGLVAALALASSALVVLISNSAAGTYHDTSRAKAFNAAEGALNTGMATLQAGWPTTQAASPTFPASTFRSQYPASEFPNPASGDFTTVSFFDNTNAATGTTGTLSPATSPTYDKGGPAGASTPDNLMFVRATARVGNGVATVQGLVQRTLWNPQLPRGVAAYAQGTITSNSQGGGTMPKVAVEVAPPTGQVAAYAGTGYSPAAIMESGIVTVANTSPYWQTPDQIMPPAIIAGIKQMAIASGRYFSGASAVTDALNSAKTTMGGPGLNGLTYIEPATGTSGSVALPENSLANPALLFLMGGNNWGFNNAGNMDAYGIFYTQGNYDFARGTVTCHGSIFCMGDVGFKGTPQTLYNDNVWINLTQEWTLNVRLVPNTWRELSPGATN